jgi:hypothetical protein
MAAKQLKTGIVLSIVNSAAPEPRAASRALVDRGEFSAVAKSPSKEMKISGYENRSTGPYD